jgi:hypothetical protein
MIQGISGIGGMGLFFPVIFINSLRMLALMPQLRKNGTDVRMGAAPGKSFKRVTIHI